MDTAIELCKKLESLLAPQGIHIALTGGTLYMEGQRKDIDLVLYVERQRDVPRNMYDTLEDLTKHIEGLQLWSFHGFVVKASYKGRDVDFLYPEYSGGSYETM